MSARHAGLLGLLAALWGASYLLIRYALANFSPAIVVFGRSALAAAVLYVVVRVRGGAAREGLAELRRRPWRALGLGALNITIPFLLITVGETAVPTGLTAVLIAPSSLFVAMFAPALDRSEIIDRRQTLGLVIGMTGVALLVGVETVHSRAEFLGALGILAAAACYALSSFMVKGDYGGLPAVTTSFISVGAGALLTAPAALATLPDHAPGTRAVLALTVLGVAGTALAFVIFYELIGAIGAGRASLVTYLVPPLSLAYGAALLDERITAAGVGGLVLILAGVGLASRRSSRVEAEVSPPESAARRTS